jgi:RNA polymerase sigma-70 factor (ECF subfamily)
MPFVGSPVPWSVPTSNVPGERSAPAPAADAWLSAFHAGETACLEACYRDHFDTVDRAVRTVVQGADRETLVHEVFARLLEEEPLRRAFTGGSLGAWLRTVARNQAIDYARRRRFEVTLPDDDRGGPEGDDGGQLERAVDMRLTLARFRQLLPAKWHPVFDARFVAQQDQSTAARALGLSRTTLAYQEYRVRKLLQRFVLRGPRGERGGEP